MEEVEVRCSVRQEVAPAADRVDPLALSIFAQSRKRWQDVWVGLFRPDQFPSRVGVVVLAGGNLASGCGLFSHGCFCDRCDLVHLRLCRLLALRHSTQQLLTERGVPRSGGSVCLYTFRRTDAQALSAHG